MTRTFSDIAETGHLAALNSYRLLEDNGFAGVLLFLN
jgi:hypothetical protein